MSTLRRPVHLIPVLPAAAAAAVVLLASIPCCAGKPPAVQFVNIAPLPGAGSALNPDGKPDGRGALQVNIPVAYTPGSGYMNIAAYSGEYIRDTYGLEETNGSGVLGFGFGTWPRFFGSAMAVSHLLRTDSKAVNAQLQVVKESARTPAFAIGAQDLLNKEEKDFGDVANTGVSYYGVATKKVMFGDQPAYFTLGYGRARFLDTVFYGVSVPINDYLSFAAEHDGFQYNAGLAWRPGGRYSAFTVLGAYNEEAGWLYGVQATGKGSGWWALPALMLLIRR